MQNHKKGLNKLTPYQKRLIEKWKGRDVVIEFTDIKRPNLAGTIIDLDVHRNAFILESYEGDEYILLNGVRLVHKASELVPESISSSRKQYGSIPEA